MEYVSIRRQFNDYRVAEVPLTGLSEIHWSRISGGVYNIAPQPFIHAYVWCNKIEGVIAHSCEHGPAPHHIKIVILKKDNTSEIFEKILEKAGPRPEQNRAKPYNSGPDIENICNALITGTKHPAIELMNHKDHGEIIVIKPKNIERLIQDGTDNTIRARAKKVKLAVESRISSCKGLTGIQYGCWLSYKKID